MVRVKANQIEDLKDFSRLQKIEDFVGKTQINFSISNQISQQFLYLVEILKEIDTVELIKVQDHSVYLQDFSLFFNSLQQGLKTQNNFSQFKLSFERKELNKQETNYLRKCFSKNLTKLCLKFKKISQKLIQLILEDVKINENIQEFQLKISYENKLDVYKILEQLFCINHLKKLKFLLPNQLLNQQKLFNMNLQNCEFLESSLENLNAIQNIKSLTSLRKLSLIIDKTDQVTLDTFLIKQIPFLDNIKQLNVKVLEIRGYILRFLDLGLSQLKSVNEFSINLERFNKIEFSEICQIISNKKQIKLLSYRNQMNQIQFEETLIDHLSNIQHLKIFTGFTNTEGWELLKKLENLITIQLIGLYEIKQKYIFKIKRLVSFQNGF